MSKVLISWVGNTDLRAVNEGEQVGLGPIGQALKEREFDSIFLLNNYPKVKGGPYLKWLQAQTQARIDVRYINLSKPTNFGEIYEAAVGVIQDIHKSNGPTAELIFHLSPGTPAMAAVWIILAKTRYPAELIESSQVHGVTTASVPFEMSAEFIPNLLGRPDEKLKQLSSGLPLDAPGFSNIIHRSSTMQKLIEMAQRVAPRSTAVLIEGESGTGKELLASAIHRASPRRNKPLVIINCGAIPAELVESELFGHEKGAFTGANKPRTGHFEAADKGTLFLDEIGELPLAAQVKMLRALQEGEITSLGSRKSQKVDVRIIAATNRSLIKEVNAGRFREDLFYRLAVAILYIPPLRDRQGDIGLLIDGFLEVINRESKMEPGFEQKALSPSARNLLLKHSFPGNVRELQNTLLRAAIWSTRKRIEVEDIRAALLPTLTERRADILDRPLDNDFDLKKLLNEIAQHYLKQAIEQAHGNKTRAAKLVGFPSYQTFNNWMRRYEIE
jgi:transcriptional regulator with PAS, ATPase and Fis domain